jgi:hypothetical protein
MNILLLQKDKKEDKLKILNDKIIWFGDKTLSNNNRLFFIKEIKYTIILYDSSKDNYNDIVQLIHINNSLNLQSEIIFYAIINQTLNDSIYKVLNYINTIRDIIFVQSDINNIDSFINNLDDA